MASKAKVTQMVGAIKTLYSYYAKDVNTEQLIQLWTGLLKAYTDEEASYGLAEAMKVCTMPPTPADVIEHIERRRDLARDTDVLVWDKLRQGLNECYRLTGYFGDRQPTSDGRTFSDIAHDKVTKLWESLPIEAQRFIGSEQEFIRKSRLDEKSLSIEESRFRKAFPSLRETAKQIERVAIATEERRKLNGAV